MNKKLLVEKLTELNIMFNPKKSTEEIYVLADMWFEDVGHISDELFLRSLAVVRQAASWFPVPADILATYRHIVASPEYQLEQTAKMIEHNESITRPSTGEMQDRSRDLKAKLRLIGGSGRSRDEPKLKRKIQTPAEKRHHRERVMEQAREIKAR